MSPSNRLRALSVRDLGWDDRLGRELRRPLHAAAASRLTRGALIDTEMRRTLNDRTGRIERFRLPSSVAIRNFGSALALDLPSNQLLRRLPDWLQCGAQRLHVSEYFLGVGDWGAVAHDFQQTSVYREAEELWQSKLDFRRTEAYACYLRHCAEGRPMRRNKVFLDSQKSIDGYFEAFVGLFHSIAEHGLLRRADLRQRTLNAPVGVGPRRWRSEVVERDPGIALDATGEVYRLPGAQHRTAIGLVLGLPTMPVEVRLIHGDFLRNRFTPHALVSPEALRAALVALKSP